MPYLNASERSRQSRLLDLHQAKQMVEAFCLSCNAPCRLLDEEGDLLAGTLPAPCQRCRALFPAYSGCQGLHRRSGRQSERFGGRYIYFCPLGMAWITSAVMLKGQAAGWLSCGPFLIMEPEDHLAGVADQSAQTQQALEELLGEFPCRKPEELNHLSLQLLANALFIGDSSLAILEEHHFAQQSRSIQRYQMEYAPTQKADYPFELEAALVRAVQEGDGEEARELLNRFLAYLLYVTGGDHSSMRICALELMSVLSRGAIEGGGDREQVQTMNHWFLQDIDHLRSTDEMVLWLTRLTTRYATLVYEGTHIRRKDVMFHAIHYMKQNLAGSVTLEDTARQSNLSPNYFSKVFKEEMGYSFNQYLSRLRVERAKTLLTSTDLSVAEISGQVGYEGESYFIKIFTRFTGVTPGKYRKHGGRTITV